MSTTGFASFDAGRWLGNQILRHSSVAARPHHPFADQAGQTAGIVGTDSAGDGLEPCDGTAAIDDKDRRARFDTVDQPAEAVLGFRNAGSLY
jgi:hypothetical protein